MTGYAAVETHTELGTLKWEMRSVNHRFLELGIKLPEELRGIESACREQVQRQLARGKVEIGLRFRPTAGAAALRTDDELLQNLGDICSALQVRFPGLRPASVSDLLSWPGAIRAAETPAQDIQALALSGLAQLLADFDASRLREGEQLGAGIAERGRLLSALRAQAIALQPEIKLALGERLKTRLGDLALTVDSQRFEQELVLLLGKADVQEELDRLAVHLIELDRVLGLSEPVGRRLDFLIQELGREVNTFGAKSIDARTSQLAVDMKVALEQIREQVQNIE